MCKGLSKQQQRILEIVDKPHPIHSKAGWTLFDIGEILHPDNFKRKPWGVKLVTMSDWSIERALRNLEIRGLVHRQIDEYGQVRHHPVFWATKHLFETIGATGTYAQTKGRQ